jgi:TIR domain
MSMNPYENAPTTVDFFISYTAADREWALWIAWELERAGFTYRIQAEHFPPGSRFITEMRRWLQGAAHLVAVLSPDYFESRFASLEMNSAVAIDPLGARRLVIPIKVVECEMPVIFADLVYVDLVGKQEEDARKAIVAGVRAARLGIAAPKRVRERQTWPPHSSTKASVTKHTKLSADTSVRIQFFACDVGRGLDLRGQHRRLKAAIEESPFAERIDFRGEFDVTDANVFHKLNLFQPNVVHISGNQNGGDVLFPSIHGGEVVVPDVALAGLLSSLGQGVRIVIVDTCKSYACAKRISEVVEFALGVDGEPYDHEATLFYETLYRALASGHSIADAYGQSKASLQFKRVPEYRVPRLCIRKGSNAEKSFLVDQ